MTEETVVPEYRTVVGTRSDEYGRPLVIKDPNLYFINEDRLRQGVAELEKFSSYESDITVRDISKSDKLKEVLDVEVSRFSFHPTAVEGVISSIRSQMIDWIYNAEKKYPSLEITVPDKEISKQQTPDRFRGLRIFGISILIIAILAGSIIP